jgi:O-succinylbenzoic acid--CoA ligase
MATNIILNQKKVNLSRSINLDLNNDEYDKKVLSLIEKFRNNELKYILKTSGSTGVPKEISFTVDQIITSTKMTANYFNLSNHSKLFSCLSIEHVAGFMMLMRSLVLDCELNIVSPSTNPFKDIEENEFDFSAFVPLHFYELFEKYPDKISQFNKIKKIIIGGSSIPINLEEKILKTFSNDIYATYGMTETLTHIAIRQLGSDYFYPLDGVIIEKDNRDCLNIISPVNYNEKIITNDLVELKSDKSFKILGRIDNVINSGGVKIQAEKIENFIEKLFYTNDIDKNFFVYPQEDEKFGNIVMLVIEGLFDNYLVDLINNKSKEMLEKYECPKKILFVDKFERTILGKVDKRNTIKK